MSQKDSLRVIIMMFTNSEVMWVMYSLYKILEVVIIQRWGKAILFHFHFLVKYNSYKHVGFFAGISHDTDGLKFQLMQYIIFFSLQDTKQQSDY